MNHPLKTKKSVVQTKITSNFELPYLIATKYQCGNCFKFFDSKNLLLIHKKSCTESEKTNKKDRVNHQSAKPRFRLKCGMIPSSEISLRTLYSKKKNSNRDLQKPSN